MTDVGGTEGEPRHLRIVVVGAGMAGILSAIKLGEAGYDDLVVYEKADRLGGTWRENTYPGIACDVPSHLYSYSFALNPDWSHAFSDGAEIQAYFEKVAADHGILDRIRFEEQVTSMVWRDGRWHLRTSKGTEDVADVVIGATGVLHHPKLPEIEGLGSFAGAAFHSARWDHDVELSGKRVGVIGTGSTAVQITGALAAEVGEYVLFQRTAQWIMPQENPAYGEAERAAMAEDPERLVELHQTLSDAFEGFSHAVVEADSAAMAWIESECASHLERAVEDPELRERLRPDHRAGCKRLVISGDFYPGIQQPNAHLITEGIECIEPEGVRLVDGSLVELDVLVLATGFHTDAFLRPMEVVGRDGVTLADVWDPRPVAYLAVAMPDLPNLFLLNGPNGPVGNFSLIEVAELQLAYVMQLVEQLRSGGATEVTPTYEATEAFEDERLEASKTTIWASGCSSWYLDDRGVPAVWPFRFSRFREEMAAPKLEAYDLR
jgi:cation diffusion facilitator CzcD-associated flavoprotein CzcO